MRVLGDLNDFEDSTALTEFLSGSGTDTTLQNLWSRAPADERYSYAYDGQLQTLDHMFVTGRLRSRVQDFRYVHFDNDYYERNPLMDATKVSDHDVALATIRFDNGRDD
jgi:predicted extracellular nuclease